MTVPAQDRFTFSSGNGVTTTFPYTFMIPGTVDDPQFLVYLIEIATGVRTDLTVGVDYSISGLGVEEGGVVTYPLSGTPLAATHRLVIESNMPYEQQTDVYNSGTLYLSAIEGQFDNTTRQVQQIQDRVNRTFSVGIGYSGNYELFPVANQLIGWDATGTALENKQAEGESAAAALVAQLEAEAAQAAAEAAAASINQRIFTSLAEAQATIIPASVKRISTQFHTPNYAIPSTLAGGAHYRRVSLADLTGYPTQSYFRSADRFMLDETTDATNGGYWIIDERTLHPSMFGPSGTGNDTEIVQAALDMAGSFGKHVDLQGVWSVTNISIDSGTAFFQISGNAEINGVDTASQTCVVEIKRGNFSITGSMAAVGGYKTNYACGFWVWHPSQLQATVFDKLISAGCLVGMKIGHPDYPSSIVSENTFEGFRTYGCPEVLHVIGAQTYVMIGNPPAMSADAFGGDAAWAALPKRCVVNHGANVSISIGEVLQTTSSSANDAVFEMRPIVASGELSWGRLKVSCSYIETAGPLCLINNPGGLTGLNTAKDRSRFVLSFADGFVGGNTAPFIKVANGAGYTGDIVLDYPNFWHNGTRTYANLDCGDNLCHIHVRGHDFGGGFLPILAGITGGILHFERRNILQAYDLPAAALASGVLKFQSTVAGGDLARWQPQYSSSTGGFTVPTGGFREIRIVAHLNATGITGSLVVKKNGSVVIPASVTTNVFHIDYHEIGPSAGDVYTVELSISSGSGSPTTSAGPNFMWVDAAR